LLFGPQIDLEFVGCTLWRISALSLQDEEAILSKLEASSVVASSGSEAVSSLNVFLLYMLIPYAID